MTLEFGIRKPEGGLDRSGFECGVPALDEYLRSLAGQDARRGLSVTYVAVPMGSTRVVGYYSLSAGRIGPESIPESGQHRLPGYSVPVVKIARLAVDRSVQGLGLGSALLTDALRRTHKLSAELGIHAVDVEAMSAEARDFYLRHGFTQLVDDPRHLYLPLATLRRLLDK